MITSGIERILISVSDMDESLAFYRDWVGLKVIADQELESDVIQQYWKLSRGTNARAVFLKNDEQPTMLELIEFKPTSKKTIREEAQPWDYGFYDIAFLVKDLEKTYIDLIEKGFAFVSPPTPIYSPEWFPIDVKEAVLIGPNEVPIAHMEVISTPRPDFKGDYGKIMDSVLVVEDIDEAIGFYKDIINLTLQGEYMIPRGLVDEVLRLLPGTDARVAFFNQECSNAPVLQLMEFSHKGKFLSPAAKPPNLGIFMISFETDDISGLIEKFNKEGINIISGPIEMEVASHGRINTIIIEAPGKVMVEFFEK